ncbi:GDSL family lipase [Candidatus Bathyarchaeota archaeon]|nr:MAG: GDSL family lipase [Candidatus Bathyarchaeota archaeon]
MSFRIKSGERFVFIGDSITDCGRRMEFAPLGNGYVSMVVNLVTAKYPERRIRWINKGISGDTVQGLVERWTEDVVNEEPDWVSIAIGINNVARDKQSGRNLKECLRDFRDSYKTILERTKTETDAKIVMSEIFYLKEEDEISRDLNVDAYNEIIHQLATEHQAILVPLQQTFKKAKTKRPDYSWTRGDGVHPLPTGHTLIALTFLNAMKW